MLVVDVGNTCMVFGLYEGDMLTGSVYVPHERSSGDEELMALLKSELEKSAIGLPAVSRVGISNVISCRSAMLRRFSVEHFRCEPVFVSCTSRTGISIDIENPAELGPDLIASAAAGYRRYRDSLIIVDLGTATTFSLISRDGVIRGAVIAPGINVCAAALRRRIPYLPEVAVTPPPSVLGRTTVDSVQSGLFYGHAAMIEGIVGRMAKEFGRPGKVILCGGLSTLMKGFVQGVDAVDPHLILEGIRMICLENG